MQDHAFRNGISLFCLGICPFQLIAQTAPPIRVDSTNIVIDVRVFDGKGRPIVDLGEASFRVSENGMEQKLVGFYPPAGSRSDARTTAETNASREQLAPLQGRGRPPGATGRLVSLVVDQANISSSGRKLLAKALTEHLNQEFSANTYVSVYVIGAQLRLIAPFTQDAGILQESIRRFFDNPNDAAFTTSDKDHLEQQLRQLIEREQRATTEAQAEAIRAQKDALQQAAWAQVGLQARTLFAGLRAIAQSGVGLPGRKTIVLFSEGFGHSPDALNQAAAVIDAANRANTTIYVLDPAGIRSPVTSSGEAQYRSNESAGGRGTDKRRVLPNTVNEQMKEIADRARQRRYTVDPFDAIRHVAVADELADLMALAEQTGGSVFQGQNDLRRSLRRIDEENAQAYTLVYRPENANFDGMFRKIKVEVAGGGAHLRYRSGYWAIAPGEQERLTPAAAQILASIALGTLKPDVTAMKLNGAVVFDAAGHLDLPLCLQTVPRRGAGLLVLTARDSSGKLLDAAQRSVSEVDQVEGRTQLYARLRVPALQQVQLSAVLQWADGSAVMATRNLGALGGDVQSTSLVVTDRVQPAQEAETVLDALKVGRYQLLLPFEEVFGVSDPLTVFAEVESAASALQGQVVIRSGAGVVLTSPLAGLARLAVAKRFRFLRQVRVDSLPAGAYTLDMRVFDGEMKPVLARSTSFEIQTK